MMSGNRPQQSPGGASSVPSTSSSSSTGNSNSSGGSNAVTSNGNNSANVVPSRTLPAATEGGLAVPTLAAVPSSRGGFASLSRPSASSGSRKKSHHQAPLYNGLLNSYEDKSNDFVCPICFEMIEEAHMTKCGHSFCFKCIRQSLEDSNRCPKCNYIVDNVDQLYPNFLVNELILKQKQRSEEKRLKLDHPNGSRWQVFQDVLSPDQENLDLANVNLMLELLVQKKKQLEAESQAAQRQILMEFLKEARRNKREQLEQLQKELNFLEEDIKRVEEMSGLYCPMMEAECTVPNVEAPSPAPSCSSIIEAPDYSQPPGFGGTTQGKRQTWYNSTLASRRKRLTAHFEDLEQCYFSNKMSRITGKCPLVEGVSFSHSTNAVSVETSLEMCTGSENNSLYLYYKGLSKTLLTFKFDTVKSVLDKDKKEDDTNEFVSAVCWRALPDGESNVLIAANSQGTIKVLELV
ncbi:E3 ubiquitin-protein ligase COP1 [Notothenia coriiceps]|uniref:E3 ubiquitin-protein ligase COP1 n=1 Tax=Notothenia coriiceps TaxID=8208 RepID=A0A6I9MYW0_9TELE|nr:PREDICTED: E3 ubiquitin-protein ligase RFWD2 [Notothenia coriiceps]